MMRSLTTKFVALLLLGALIAAAAVYPADRLLLGLALAIYAVLLWMRPEAWLLAVPALLPVLDLTPWSGWFYLEELDLVLLLSAAVGYWRLGAGKPLAATPPFFAFALGLVACSFFVAAGIGVLPLQPLDANAFANYNSHYNGLRILKGFAWALVLLPLLRLSAGQGLANIQKYFVPGMLIGLAGACLAVAWERAIFPGLLNFSSDYRPTAPFSAMHTGGAALDAYLAMAFPFVAIWLMDAGSHVHAHLRTGLALLLLLLGCYAGFAMFSRDIYLAFGSSGLIVLALGLAPRARQGSLKPLPMIGAALLLAVLAYVLTKVFATSGYRGLAASLGLLIAAVVLGSAEGRIKHLALFIGGALAMMLIDTGLFVYAQSSSLGGLSKGPYLGFVLSGALFALGALQMLFGSPVDKPFGLAIAAAGFPGMGLTTGFVAWHWGGSEALLDAGCLIIVACIIVAANRLLPQPLWRPTRRTLMLTFLSAIVFATAIPVAGSYYLGSRFSTVGDDFSVRLRHWREALDMMASDWKTQTFGMGLGRYPETYFWNNTHGELPGSYAFRQEDNNLFLRLGTPQYAIGYGEVLRMLQHVDIEPGRHYRLSLDVRRPAGKAGINLSVCERWLLYPRNCVPLALHLQETDGAWHHYEVPFDSGRLGEHSLLLYPPIQFEVSADGANAAMLDVDNISIQDPSSGKELIRNGSFSRGNDYWFFSSDRNHFPWHIKNFFVNMVFEQGWVGAAALGLLLLYVLGDLLMRGLHRDRMAVVCLASLVGCLLIGMFDSIFDVPRLTTLFFLIILVGVSRPVVERKRRRRHSHSEQPERSEPAPAGEVRIPTA